MHRFKVMLALFLVAFGGVSLASAAGTGTFSTEQVTPSVGVGQFGIASLVMDNTWTPPADSVTLTLKWDPAVIQYVSTDWKVGNSVDAAPSGADTLVMNFADFTKKYPTGRVTVADINFKGLRAGQSTMSITVSSVRSHVGISETEFTDLTAAALTNPGTFTVGQGGGVVTPVTTAPVGTTLTTVPTLTIGTGTTVPVVPTVPGNVTGTITTIATLVPTTGITTGISTGVPFVPSQGVSSGSDEYTGVLTRTPTVTATRTATVSATATAIVTSNATSGTGNATGKTVVQIAQANPNLSTLVSALQTAGLVDVLNGTGPFTVFAPTNAAFDKLPPGTLQGLLANKTELTRVLTYHVAAGRYTSDNLTATKVVKTVEGENVNVTVENGRVRVDGAIVTQSDIQASNGVVHVVDAVMIPPASYATATQTAIATTPANTTVRTTVPVNTTATKAGADVLPLAVAGLAALAVLAVRRR